MITKLYDKNRVDIEKIYRNATKQRLPRVKKQKSQQNVTQPSRTSIVTCVLLCYVSYIHLSFEVKWSGVSRFMSPNTSPQYPLPHVMSHTIALLVQKKHHYTHILIYLYFVVHPLYN